jgi:AcrR family transcriptional regulator
MGGTMARVANEEITRVRRNQILEVARQLVFVTKGFSEMSIQDILDELGLSKGAFYHYFSSKAELLEALIEHLVTEATPLMNSVVDDPDLNAPDKLVRFFHSMARWKTDRKDYLLALLRLWYADENAVVREKYRQAMPVRFGPILARLVAQGVDEGAFDALYPDLAGRVILSLLFDMNDLFAAALLAPAVDAAAFAALERAGQAYNQAVERVLGATPGSLELLEPDILRAWFEPSREFAGAPPT